MIEAIRTKNSEEGRLSYGLEASEKDLKEKWTRPCALGMSQERQGWQDMCTDHTKSQANSG